MRLVRSSVLVLGLAACATGESPNLDGASDPSVLGGSAGSGGSEATAGSDSAGTFNSSGSTSGGSATAGSSTFGGQTFGGQLTGGTFGMAGTVAVGGGGTGGTSAGGGGAGGAGGKAGAGGTGGKAGSGGTGGMPNGTCAENPITAKNTWTATALPVVTSACPDVSDYCAPAERALDGMANTRFSTGRARMGDEYYQIDFGDTVTVSRVVLNTAAGSGDYTLGYEIRMADTEGAVAGSAVIIAGNGMQGTTTINFPSPKTGRFLRIDQTETMSGWWSLTEIDVSCQ